MKPKRMASPASGECPKQLKTEIWSSLPQMDDDGGVSPANLRGGGPRRGERQQETEAENVIKIPIWGGIEATVNRVGDEFLDQFKWSGHAERLEDLDLAASLGIRKLRLPILWERVAPSTITERDWTYPDAALSRLQQLGVEPIAGLCHHGSGPAYTNLLDPEFPEKLAVYARQVAERYPWINEYTPVNEPLTTARFSALYGHWYPHATDELSFCRALLNQCRAVVLAMREIRKINPSAKLVQTDDLGKVHATERLQYQADFENERRWLTWDLLAGLLTPDKRMWGHLLYVGIASEELQWFLDNPCVPDVIGINHYISSERFLDHRIEHHPPDQVGGNGRDQYVDVLAARVREEGCDSFAGVLKEAWDRYGLPMAVTECHMGCTREEQLRWLIDSYHAAQCVKSQGANMIGFTVWSMFGAYDWNSLLTTSAGHYEPGVFDLRSPEPRPTVLADAVKALADGKEFEHPAMAGPAWWQRKTRFHAPPASVESGIDFDHPRPKRAKKIVVAGADGSLAHEVLVCCELRGLSVVALSKTELDVTDPDAAREAIKKHRPWALINASGRVAESCAAEEDAEFFRVNTCGSAALAGACAMYGAQYVTFSSDCLFDGKQAEPYTESDTPRPRNAYGRSQLEAERCVLSAHPEALVVRTSNLFGPLERKGRIYKALTALAMGEKVNIDADSIVSPTFAPDLVNTVLDLLIDGEQGIWHLTNLGSVPFSDFLAELACLTELRPPRRSKTDPMPNYALTSEKAWILPSWQNAIERYAEFMLPQLTSTQKFSLR